MTDTGRRGADVGAPHPNSFPSLRPRASRSRHRSAAVPSFLIVPQNDEKSTGRRRFPPSFFFRARRVGETPADDENPRRSGAFRRITARGRIDGGHNEQNALAAFDIFGRFVGCFFVDRCCILMTVDSFVEKDGTASAPEVGRQVRIAGLF